MYPALVNFSELLRSPTAILARLLSGGVRGLRLARRGEPDLYLTTAERADQVTEVMRSNVRMFHALLNDEKTSTTSLERALAEAHPWVRFLPEEDRHEFLIELIETSRASTELDAVAPIFQVITEWRNTAEIHADPMLHKELSRDSDGSDHGPVPMPEVHGA